ncbi:phytanoyl-CoA dioxygenase family protein [Actinomadura monticuli]|uniref:Phytanoyl-CoA dioxygenase family protein n=1 Tax=Actinomadura monticuli TaxID=3097367 RepID=A0ABV4Q4U8_9ACTN
MTAPIAKVAIDAFRDQGFLVLEGFFEGDRMADLAAAADRLYRHSGDELVHTSEGELQSIYGIHRIDGSLPGLLRQSGLLPFCEEIAGGPVYIFQSQLHDKPMSSTVLSWHQDFYAFSRFDGLADPRGLSVAVFLDEIRAHNAPISVIRRSHRKGVLTAERTMAVPRGPAGALPAGESPDQDGKHYEIDTARVAELAHTQGVETITGPAGSVLFMDLNLVHASGVSLLPERRAVLHFSMVSVEVGCRDPQRPEFVATRTVVPL